MQTSILPSLAINEISFTCQGACRPSAMLNKIVFTHERIAHYKSHRAEIEIFAILGNGSVR
jgi:hypothetical protein